MAILMDGKKLREKKYLNFHERIKALKEKNIIPKLVVVLVGDNEASKIYVGHKKRACKILGIESGEIILPKNTSYQELKKVINDLNNDQTTDGILLQLPVPGHLRQYPISLLIDPKKDVDGVNPLNHGVNLTKENTVAPISCTPNGILEFFEEYKVDLSGKNVVIIGRSNIVGKPLSYLMTNKNATVTIVHTKTKPETFQRLIKNADIIVSASGATDTFTPEMVKDQVVIIDVGIIRINKKLRGDVDYKKFLDKASYITPVPGGVGPMTVTMLMNNVILLTELNRGK